jgi:hypothetical protein
MFLFTFLVPIFSSIISIQPPSGFTRIKTEGFGTYLRKIALKKDKTVYLFNGEKKANQNAQYAVLDVSVGDRDLQQCADAVMRLRAEYLYDTKQNMSFRTVQGKYVPFNGNNRGQLMKYMDFIFTTCNSYSLERQMMPTPIHKIKIGDVLIKGGFPGHVVIVVDMAVNAKGEKLMMLAQSFMPAQDIHILKGPIDEVWYPVREGEIKTPEWIFDSSQAKTW